MNARTDAIFPLVLCEPVPGFTADCGHFIAALPAGYTGGSGYAVWENRKICYDCAAKDQARRMVETGKATLYFIDKAGERRVCDWADKISFPVSNVTRSKGHSFGGEYPIVTGRFRGPDGALWFFRNAGDNQIARCKRLKDPRG